MTSKKSSLSRSKKILFSLILVFLGVLFLIAFEMVLRLFDYGSDYPLFYKKQIFNKEKYVVNRQVARRYFNLPPNMIPEASEESFNVNKKKGVLRLFCLGGSTTAGFPYEINATFPFQLQYRLRNALMNREEEVINLGISAVNSYTVLDLLPEILEMHPDGLIIYMGHNEFYGALGVGSTQYISSNRQLIKLYLKLRRLRLTQFLNNLLSSVINQFKSSGTNPESMMEAMAREQEIPLNDKKVQIAAQNFEANLREIIKKARAHHVPVLLSTLVSNLKDQPPFIGHFSSTMDEMTRQQLEARLLVAKNHYISGDWKSALQELSQINQIDSSHAEVHFLLGRCYLQAGDSLKAYQHFSRARDLDELRFRAPSFFNRILKKVAKAEDVPLVDIEAVFRKASPEGITGNELLHEHLHPNFDGYRLMAQTYLEALRTVQILNPPRPIRWDSTMLTPQKIGQIIEKFTLDSAGVTELDLEFGAVRNYILLNRWPFEGTDRQLRHYKPFHNAITKQLAIRHYRDKTYWDKSHYDLAEYYLERGLDYKAFREYRAVYFAFPDNYYPVMKMGDMMFRLQKFQQALNWYKQAQHLVPNNPHINAKLGNIFILMNDFPKALTYLNSAVQIDRQRKTFNKDERLNVLYLLAVTQANLLKFDEALNTIREALELNPNFESVLKLKNDIEAYLSARKGKNEK